MSDEGDATKKEALESLQALLSESRTPVENLQKELKSFILDLKENGCYLEDTESEIEEIEDELESELHSIQDLFQETELTVRSAQDKYWEIVKQFQKEKINRRAKIDPLRKHLKKLMKTYSQKMCTIKEDRNRKEQLKTRLDNMYDQIKKIVEEVIQEILSATNTSVEKFPECDTLKSELGCLRQSLNDKIDKFTDSLYEARSKIDRFNDKCLQEECVSKFQETRDSIKEEVTSIRENVQHVLKNHSHEVKSKNMMTQEEKDKLLSKLCRLHETKSSSINKIRLQLDEWLKSIETDNLEKDHKAKLNDVKQNLTDLTDKLGEYLNIAKSEISQSDNTLYANKCLLSFRSNVKELENDLEEEGKKFRGIVDTNSTMIKAKREERERKITELKETLRLLAEDVIEPAEKLRESMERMKADVECENFKGRFNIMMDVLNEQINSLRNCYEVEMQSILETYPVDEDAQNKIVSSFRRTVEKTQVKIEKEFEKMQIKYAEHVANRLKQTEMIGKLKTNYDKSKFLAYEMQQKISDVLSGQSGEYVDKDEMVNEIIGIDSSLRETMNSFDNAFNNGSEQIATSNDIGLQYNSLMDFRTMCETLEKDVVAFQSKFEKIAKKYDVSPAAVLSRTIRAKASKLNLQLEDKNNLNIFKLPLRETHSIPAEKLRRFELGDPRPDKSHHHVLLVGMTGSGKSLLINNMINYIYGVSHRDKFRFKLIVESEEIGERVAGASRSLADSMTSWVTSFTFHWQEGFRIPYSFTIIDTPGFGDTRGLQYDEEIIGQIRKFVNNNRLCPNQELSSIGLLIQASQARITEEQKYIFDQVLNLFGKDMKDNIFLIFTFADAQPPPALETVKANGIPYSEENSFKFNNSALYAPIEDELSIHAWNFGFTNLDKYFEILIKKEPISLALTKQVLDEREQLRLILGTLQAEISNGMETLRLIEYQSTTILNIEGTIQSKKGFKVKKRIFNCERKVVSHHITNCSKCCFTCHSPCYIAGDMKQGCASMRGGSCVVCPAKCPYTMHTNGTNVYVYTPVEIEETIEDMMKDYNVAVDEKGAKKKLLMGMLAKYQTQKEEVFRCIQIANDCSNRLEEISLRASYLTNVQYIEILIQSEERSSRPNKDNRLKQLRHLKDMAETLRDAKANPDSLTSRVSEYESRIADIINNIKDEEVQPNQVTAEGHTPGGLGNWISKNFSFGRFRRNKNK